MSRRETAGGLRHLLRNTPVAGHVDLLPRESLNAEKRTCREELLQELLAAPEGETGEARDLCSFPDGEPVAVWLLRLPVRQVVEDSVKDGECSWLKTVVFVVEDGKVFKLAAAPAGSTATEFVDDVGFLVRIPSPLDQKRTPALCSGVLTRGLRRRPASHPHYDGVRLLDLRSPQFCYCADECSHIQTQAVRRLYPYDEAVTSSGRLATAMSSQSQWTTARVMASTCPESCR